MQTFTQDGITAQSNDATAEELKAAFDQPSDPVQPDPDQPPPVDAPAQDTQPAEPATPKPSSRETRKQSIQQDIDQAIAERSRVAGETTAARAERDRITAELATLRAERATLAKPAPASAPAGDPTDPEPTEDQFDTYGQYVKAQARWEARQEFKEQQAKSRENFQREQASRAEQARKATFAERLTKAREQHPDFDTRVDVDLPLSLPMQDVIQDAEAGPGIMLYLAEHKDEAERIFALKSQLAQFGEMKKIEARVEAAVSGPVSRPRPVSQAPAPLKPLGGTPNAADRDGPPDPETCSQEEYEAYWNPKARRG